MGALVLKCLRFPGQSLNALLIQTEDKVETITEFKNKQAALQ